MEVLNLDPNKVHKLQAWVMHNIEAGSRYVTACSRLIVSESACEEMQGHESAAGTDLRAHSALSPPSNVLILSAQRTVPASHLCSC